MSSTTSPSTAAPFDNLLKAPKTLLALIQADQQSTAIARSLLLTIVWTTALFGAALGFFRGGIQIFYAGVKLPLVVLLTAAICAPALSALNAALGRSASLRRDLNVVLAVLARAGLVLAAATPMLLFAHAVDVSYHKMILLATGCCAVAGLVGVGLLWNGLVVERQGRFTVALVLLALFALVGTQMSWTLRPYLLRPQATHTPFVRALEGNFVESVGTSIDSAQGRYRYDEGSYEHEHRHDDRCDHDAECGL